MRRLYNIDCRVTSPTQRPLPDNTQYSQHTDIHVSGGIRTHHDQQASDRRPSLRPHGHWDRQFLVLRSLFPTVLFTNKRSTGFQLLTVSKKTTTKTLPACHLSGTRAPTATFMSNTTYCRQLSMKV
jgi:hypothetical protein